MSNPKVSVLILAYNQEKYIRETLQGAVMQETDFLYDIYVHDDASTDSTPEIIKEFQVRYPHLIKPYLQKDNQFSKGVKPLTTFIYPLLKCDYVAFCEGDDYWIDPQKLSKQVAVLDANRNYSFCGHDVKMKYEEGMEVKKNFYIKPQEGSFRFNFLDEFLNHFVATPTILVRLEHLLSLPKNDNLVSGDLYSLLYFLSRDDGYYLADKMVVKCRNLGGITMNAKYINTVKRGTYLLWKEVQKFTPRQYKALVTITLAEYQRLLIKNRALAKDIALRELFFGAIINDPYWFLGRSRIHKEKILKEIKKASR
ncbi:MAG: hypothetical protein DA405_13075 [Bacteroidetes bacterium]|nr:MAG: hypothetical protein DA405_13075 [Bacteroidota bacterium]